MAEFSVPLPLFIKELNLISAYLPVNFEELRIKSSEINRPGLLLAGYSDYFDESRLQVIGLGEMDFLEKLPENERDDALERLFSYRPSAVVVTRNLSVSTKMIDLAKADDVPLLISSESTSNFMSSAISYLSVELAPRITRHGVLVEVYGEGILIMGESGVGKSETAIELVKRGHRLVADDAVELRKVSNRSIVGTSPDNIRHFIELRGVGIINVMRIFGMGSVKLTEKVNLIVNLEQWETGKSYSRVGLENEKQNILDVEIPSITIPIKPGRNLAVIIEVAAMNYRQTVMGYNAATELLSMLGLEDDISEK
ncbi:MAG: HPr(Ser) kinase/phosphatase [Oscillospiraceae bacterium]